MKARLFFCCALLTACPSTPGDQPLRQGESKAPALGLDEASPALPVSDPVTTREAARRMDPNEIAFLRRQLSARGPSRLWAAWGLGKLCPRDRAGISAALVTALGSWVLDVDAPGELELATLARALGGCGNEEAEQVLRSWLNPDPPAALPGLPEAAALGLGSLVDRSGRLEERTLTLLLDTAEREKNARLLYPLGRLPTLGHALSARALDVAGELITRGSAETRRFGILALGSAGASASLPLAQLALQPDFPGPDRAAAVQALGRLGPVGQRTLDQTLKELLERGLPRRADDEAWLVLTALLQLIDQPRDSHKVLAELNRAPLPEKIAGPELAQRRRMLALRCRAADLVAGTNERHKALAECDPDHGRPEKEARLRVLGRGRLLGPRAALFDEITRDADPLLVQSALRLLPAHAEYERTLELLVQALASPSTGTQATALQVITAHPDRAHTAARESVPDPRVIEAISRILDATDEASALETVAAALGAAGALGTMTLKPAVERHCEGPRRALHPRAQAALALLGAPKQTCPARPQQGPAVPAPAAALGPVVIHLSSELGPLELHLDSPDTPEARASFVALVKKGYYEGATISAVLSGLAVQWGDRDGDGYDDGPEKVEAHELGPTPWTALSVGLTSFAPFAPSTQLLVTLSDAPQLTGEKLRLGRAAGPWHLLLPGDGLTGLRVE